MINYKQAAKAKQTVELEFFFKLYVVSHDVDILYLRLTNKVLQNVGQLWLIASPTVLIPHSSPSLFHRIT